MSKSLFEGFVDFFKLMKYLDVLQKCSYIRDFRV